MKKRIPRNQGRIEFISCYDYIVMMLKKGYDKRKIHQILVDDGKFTMSYSAFCYQYSRKILQESKYNFEKNVNQTHKAKSGGFPNPKDINPNDLI